MTELSTYLLAIVAQATSQAPMLDIAIIDILVDEPYRARQGDILRALDQATTFAYTHPQSRMTWSGRGRQPQSAMAGKPRADSEDDRFDHLPLGNLHPSPTNPRRSFPEASLAEMAESIRMGLGSVVERAGDSQGAGRACVRTHEREHAGEARRRGGDHETAGGTRRGSREKPKSGDTRAMKTANDQLQPGSEPQASESAGSDS